MAYTLLSNLTPTGLAAQLFLLYITYSIGQALYNLYFHPLAKFPGPAFRRASTLPSLVEGWRQSSIKNIDALHKRYGTVVRISPDALSFSTAQAWKDIYGFHQERRQIPKDYKRFPPVDDVVPILFSNDVDHSRMRRLISHAFSEAALEEQVPLIMSHIQTFIHQLRELCNLTKNEEIDLNQWFDYLTFDVVTDLSFGEPLGSLKRGAPSLYIMGFYKACRMYPMIAMIYESSLMRLLFEGMMKIPAVRRDQEMGYLATKEKVERRLKQDRFSGKDFMTYILRHNDEKGMSNPEIIGATSVFVNAGGEATAACMSAAVYLLLTHPDIYNRVKSVIRGAFNSQESIEPTAVKQLVYLTAVIEESLRLFPPTPGLFSRRTNVPTEIDGHIVPPDTSVGVHQWAANHSPENFHRPDDFVPERWLRDPPSEYNSDIKGAMQIWSLGPRNCIGKNVAYLEIRMALTLLIWHFDMELSPSSKGWVDRQTCDIIWNRQPLHVRLVPRSASWPKYE